MTPYIISDDTVIIKNDREVLKFSELKNLYMTQLLSQSFSGSANSQGSFVFTNFMEIYIFLSTFLQESNIINRGYYPEYSPGGPHFLRY